MYVVMLVDTSRGIPGLVFSSFFAYIARVQSLLFELRILIATLAALAGGERGDVVLA